MFDWDVGREQNEPKMSSALADRAMRERKSNRRYPRHYPGHMFPFNNSDPGTNKWKPKSYTRERAQLTASAPPQAEHHSGHARMQETQHQPGATNREGRQGQQIEQQTRRPTNATLNGAPKPEGPKGRQTSHERTDPTKSKYPTLDTCNTGPGG
jgi:hypothetical protein